MGSHNQLFAAFSVRLFQFGLKISLTWISNQPWTHWEPYFVASWGLLLVAFGIGFSNLTGFRPYLIPRNSFQYFIWPLIEQPCRRPVYKPVVAKIFDELVPVPGFTAFGCRSRVLGTATVRYYEWRTLFRKYLKLQHYHHLLQHISSISLSANLD